MDEDSPNTSFVFVPTCLRVSMKGYIFFPLIPDSDDDQIGPMPVMAKEPPKKKRKGEIFLHWHRSQRLCG